ncbi:hypothetical protein [Aeoliella mucimassa]|nr:hypothetical protein [Aeoliella mucimassa]
MKLLRAICCCGYHTRMVRSGRHHRLFWFPLFSASQSVLCDVSMVVPDESDSLEDEYTADLERRCTNLEEVRFNPPVGTALHCPDCHYDSLLLQQVEVTAICKRDCRHEYAWGDSEDSGCPLCGDRPHAFRIDPVHPHTAAQRSKCYCRCSTTTETSSPLDGYCPKCGALPKSYQVGSRRYCGVHHEKLLPYQMPTNHLFIQHTPPAEVHQFPLAKFWGEAPHHSGIDDWYCLTCESRYQQWRKEQEHADSQPSR